MTSFFLIVVTSFAAPIAAVFLLIGAAVSLFAFHKRGRRSFLQYGIWAIWIIVLIPLVRLWTLGPVTERREVVVETPYRTGAVCQDGWESKATGSGACSRHGGVAYWTRNYVRHVEDTVPARLTERNERRKDAAPAYIVAIALGLIGLLSLRNGHA